MRIFVAIVFGFSAFGAVASLVLLTFEHFPYERKPMTRGAATISYLAYTAIAVWAAYLLWIQR